MGSFSSNGNTTVPRLQRPNVFLRLSKSVCTSRYFCEGPQNSFRCYGHGTKQSNHSLEQSRDFLTFFPNIGHAAPASVSGPPRGSRSYGGTAQRFTGKTGARRCKDPSKEDMAHSFTPHCSLGCHGSSTDRQSAEHKNRKAGQPKHTSSYRNVNCPDINCRQVCCSKEHAPF